MNYNNIDFRALATKLSPPKLRQLRLIDWLVSLLKPLEEVNFLFKNFRKQAIYKVVHNGQVVYLEKVLNDRYDNSLRRIYITDAFEFDPTYIYPEDEELPVYIYPENEDQPRYIYPESVFGESNVDFIVFVPLDLQPSNPTTLNNFLIQMRSLINFYKLASRRYSIQWI